MLLDNYLYWLLFFISMASELSMGTIVGEIIYGLSEKLSNRPTVNLALDVRAMEKRERAVVTTESGSVYEFVMLRPRRGVVYANGGEKLDGSERVEICGACNEVPPRDDNGNFLGETPVSSMRIEIGQLIHMRRKDGRHMYTSKVRGIKIYDRRGVQVSICDRMDRLRRTA